MILTRKLITKFIPDFEKISDQMLTDAVNSLGMEVESVIKYQVPKNVVVGKILEATKVEGTHLNLCKVLVGEAEVNQIICGASNVQAGKYGIVALPGATLPNGVTIATRTIHGLESNGMMCAYSELTGNNQVVPDAEKDEIILFDHGSPGDAHWDSFIGLDDTAYDITVPANRNDETSYLVFCYEVANKLNLSFNFDFNAIEKEFYKPTNNLLVDSKICSQLGFMDYAMNATYTQRTDWVQKGLLMLHGIKPINQLLDKLAYISLLTNCPTHVYNLEKLTSNLSCKPAIAGSKFIGLNGKEYELADSDVVIYDKEKPVSLACIIGSDETKLIDTTSKIRIEVGNFAFANVRNTTLRLLADTAAAKKASKPISNWLNMLTMVLIKRTLGEPSGYTLYVKPNYNSKPIHLSVNKLGWFFGDPITRNYALDALKKQGYKHKMFTNFFIAPKWRLDVVDNEDMLEDILKIIDVNNLMPVAIADSLIPLADNFEYELNQDLKEILINNYFNEVKTYNLTNKANLDKFNMFGATKPIKIQCNNANREYFRLGLLDNMLKAYKYNDARKLALMPIFEIQKLFTEENKTINLSCLSLDKYVVDSITGSSIATNINYYKGIVNQIAKLFNVKLTFKPYECSWFYNNESVAILYGDKIIGYTGKIKASALKDYDLANKAIYCLNMNIEALFANYSKPNFKVKPFGVFQQLSKDFNIVLSNEQASLVNTKVDAIKAIDDIADAQIVSIFHKDNNVIYTVRYYLTDTKQFTTADIELIAKKVEEITK